MKHLFIVNPVAGGKNHTNEIKRKVEKLFRSRTDEYEIYVTTAPMDATRKIREDAVGCDELRVYSCGGDGTFNECVCGAALLDNVAVSPVPTGTGNDFCRMFGEDCELFRDIETLLTGIVQKIDLIECNGRFCANICSVGIDARIGTDVHKYSHLPFIGGATGYIVSAVVNLFKGLTTHMHITAPGFEVDAPITLACACNGRYYGGGFNPSISARPDDGELDILIVRKVNVLSFVSLIGKYAAGKADEIPEYITHIKGDRIAIEFGEDNVVNIDGEALFTRKVEMKLIPKALRLIVPTGINFFDVIS